MRRRLLGLVGVLLVILLATSPASSATNSGPPPDLWGRTDHEGKYVFGWRKIRSEDGKVIKGPEITINGTVWLDVDADADRQTSDPVAPDTRIVFSPRGMSGPNDLPRSITIHVFMGIDPPTGGGCVVIPYPVPKNQLTVDIRVTLYSDAHLAARDSILNWPIANGHFFKETAVGDVDLYDFAGHYQVCDGGFKVTNADGNPERGWFLLTSSVSCTPQAGMAGYANDSRLRIKYLLRWTPTKVAKGDKVLGLRY